MTIVIEQTRNDLLPVGEYPARIKGVDADEGAYGSQVRFEFEVQGGDYGGRSLLGWASAKFSQKTKLYAWTRAALDTDIHRSYSFNSNDLIGKMVELTVMVRARDDGSEFNRIEDVRPYLTKTNGDGQMPSPSGDSY